MKRFLVVVLAGLFLLSLVVGAAAAQRGGDGTSNSFQPNLQWAQQKQNNNDDSQLQHQNRHRLTINGQRYEFGDTGPVIKDGRFLIPIRVITEVLGADVEWDEDSRTVTVKLDDVTLEITLEEDTVKMYRLENDEWEEIPLDVPAQLHNNRVVVPLRLIVEALDYNVDYDDATLTVAIDTIGKGTLERDRIQDQLRDDSCLTPSGDTDHDRDRDQLRLQLRDGTCITVNVISIQGDRAQLRDRLRDGSCLSADIIDIQSDRTRDMISLRLRDGSCLITASVESSGDRDRTRQQLKDGTCLITDVIDLLGDRDQQQDQEQIRDPQKRLRNGSCVQ